MPNFNFTRLLLRSFSLDHLQLSWEISDTTLDPHDFSWYIERSESPMGPWDQMAGPFSDRYSFLDYSVNLFHHHRILYYRLKSEEKADTDNVVHSGIVSALPPSDLIAKEIQLAELTVWREFNGRICWVFPVRTFGQYCPHCMDVTGSGGTYRKMRSNCLTCFDTQYARGYLDPIETSIQIDPSARSKQNLATGQTHQTNTTARMGNFPLLKPGDIIVEESNERWRVVTVSGTERLRSPVHQEMTLHLITHGDVVYKLPINVADLFNRSSSPERNFSNPQNLESFEDESINAALKSYGYDE